MFRLRSSYFSVLMNPALNKKIILLRSLISWLNQLEFCLLVRGLKNRFEYKAFSRLLKRVSILKERHATFSEVETREIQYIERISG
jgi:hypothetical protein